ncbi:hypothetical protein [Lacticaseibacillus hulanensis]|uniref:hypothetical protein n=1 Tax=Lacticaseibacillus hulanensis TaxID=2493111 RepID=UPI000FDB42E0|nr:hypothetical protein [Lacticaseibacillus hulanensis]
MYSVVIPWAIIAIILMLVGITVVVAGIKAQFSAGWKVVLSVLGVVTFAAGTYWLLILVGLVNM